MKSPFPGLDPYLESFWSNVHTRMMTYIADQLQGQLPEGLWARVEESVTVDDFEQEISRAAYPDIHISDGQSWTAEWKDEIGGIAVAEPLVITDEPLTQRHIAIVDTRTGSPVVTAIEVLSPANKVGVVKRDEYRHKQTEYLRGGVNLVEIDLVRAGGYILSAPEDRIPEEQRDGSLISVYRVNSPVPEWEVYPVSLRLPLPAFRIPLRRGDTDIALDLQAILEQCYQNGSYHLGIDYTRPPSPPVAERDRGWMDGLLREKGLRE